MVMNGSLINKIGGLRMNEIERFEEKYPLPEEIKRDSKSTLYIAEKKKYEYLSLWWSRMWFSWQARAEIAKQYEKELIDALDKIIDIYDHSNPCRNAFIANDLIKIARKARENKNG